MTIRLTDAQAETIEELWSNGYGGMSFLPHEQFTERDNRANGARRCMRNMIKSGLIVQDNATDGRGDYYYKFVPGIADAYQDWQRRKWDQASKRTAVVDSDW